MKACTLSPLSYLMCRYPSISATLRLRERGLRLRERGLRLR